MPRVSRRQALQAAGAVVAVAAAPAVAAAQDAPAFTLPKLPYAYNALEPHIDERTMRIHHDLHHQAYVTGLNTALMGQADLQKTPLDQLLRNIEKVPQAIRQRVTNHGGGHYNHTMFWEVMVPKAGGQPNGNLARAIDTAFQSFEAFKKTFKQSALDRFGSGWAWLVVNGGRLELLSSANQDCPLMSGKTPILGIDVWEHAYYLHYQNRRADYVDAWWNVVNWTNVAQRFDRARK